jgi:Fe-S-cluster containining protein
LGSLVARAQDGTLRIPVRAQACSALGLDRACTVYEDRPTVCRLYPFQVHAGRRLQATVSLGCPGVTLGGEHVGVPLATRALVGGLAARGARVGAARARATLREFDERTREWGASATSDQLRSAFQPHADALARPELLPRFLAALAEGDLVLGRRGAVGALFEADEEGGLPDLLEEAARDAFEQDDVLWVEPDLAWSAPKLHGASVVELRGRRFEVAALPTAWTREAGDVLAGYLRRLMHRDHTEGAAAWVVDASGYQATLPAAFGRVLGEASLQVMLRAGLVAEEAGAEEVTPELAWRGVRAYETSYHSLPTLGAVL